MAQSWVVMKDPLVLEAVSAEGASSEGNCQFPGSALLKFMAPLDKAIVWLLRRPWGWIGSWEPRDNPAGTGDSCWDRHSQRGWCPLPPLLLQASGGGHWHLHTLRNAEKLGSGSLLQMRGGRLGKVLVRSRWVQGAALPKCRNSLSQTSHTSLMSHARGSSQFTVTGLQVVVVVVVSLDLFYCYSERETHTQTH